MIYFFLNFWSIDMTYIEVHKSRKLNSLKEFAVKSYHIGLFIINVCLVINIKSIWIRFYISKISKKYVFAKI